MLIKLVKSSFFNETDTKKKLAGFILNAKHLSMGEECQRFEKSFAKKQQRKYAVFVNSGSSANLVLIQALINLGKLKLGQRIGVSSLTWATNVMPIIQLGLIPIVIDCEIDTLNISPRSLTNNLEKIDALFLTNVLGFSDQITEIKKICSENEIIFIEDNCESLGSRISGSLLGNFGLASTFSFFVGHHLSTIEGGMICTNDEDLYHMAKMVRAHGWNRDLPKTKKTQLEKDHGISDFFSKYTFYNIAFNARPTEISGFLGNTQLKYWDNIVKRRFDNFNKFKKVIDQNNELLPIKTDHMDIISNFAIPVICKSKDFFNKYKKRFEQGDVEIRPIIAGNIADQPFFKKIYKNNHYCPNASFIHHHGFYFGNNAELTPTDINHVCKLLWN